MATHSYMKSILALCFSLAITCCAAKSAPSFRLESWMSDLSDVIGDKTLQDINIPGAHDAATSDIEDGGDEKTTTSDDVPADTDTDTPDELPDETETPEKQEDESKEE